MVSKQFPMERKEGTLAVTLSHPQIHFDGTQNRIDLKCDLEFTMGDLPSGSGGVSIEGTLAVGDEAILLREVQVREVTLDGTLGDNAEVMKRFVSQSLLESLDGMVVYSLGKEAASRYVAGITVTDDGIEIRLEASP